MFAQPVRVFFRKQREVVKLVAEFSAQIVLSGECAQLGGRELMLMQLGEQCAEFLRKAGAAGAAPKQFQFIRVPLQKRAQHHEPAFGGQ